MWNFGLPYKLKQLIDLVAQRNYLFTYDGIQYGPLLNVEKAVAVYTRGSRYLEGSRTPPSFDHQAPYLDFWLRLIGVRDLRSVIVDNAWNRDRQESEASWRREKRLCNDWLSGFSTTSGVSATCYANPLPLQALCCCHLGVAAKISTSAASPSFPLILQKFHPAVRMSHAQ